MYIKVQKMITRNRGGRDISELYSPDDISLVMQEKAVLLVDKYSPKLYLSHMCPSLEGRFYIGKGYLYLWNSVWVTHKDFPKDVLVEINKSSRKISSIISRTTTPAVLALDMKGAFDIVLDNLSWTGCGPRMHSYERDILSN
ncbi:hypothetical protein HPB47_016061 [Ixodes persulcatus]|uniref:Uncharacterized protein n=1 Tax=Ixodes persulcatus TaxID=34615 RepID=A0AC60QT28_IXOPE|nr:hypothetical protein HPB47_016061 [Ixodes persulcatus]